MMQDDKLTWTLAQCQFRNCLFGQSLDAMAFTLLGETLEQHPEWCDPARYVELDMTNMEAPKGWTITYRIECAGNIWANDVVAQLGKEGKEIVESALKQLFLEYSGRILAGTVRLGMVPIIDGSIDIYLSNVVATKKESEDDGTNDGTAGGPNVGADEGSDANADSEVGYSVQ